MRVPRSGALVFALTFVTAPAMAEEIMVSSSQELSDAFGRAQAGDVIRLMPGTYGFTSSVWTANDGTPSAPILVTGTTLPDVRLDFASVEALVFANSNWILENVWVNGICTSPTDCQAGVGLKPGGDGFTMRGCRITNWTQHLKASRTPDDEADDASIVGNEFYNDVAIDGSPIDIVGGKRWLVADNFVHDFGGDPSNGDYGIFLKGATSNGVVERNLVICGLLRPSFGVEVGISFGGGGTGFQFCPNMDCSCEDTNSIARNNIVLNCSDAGMHTKRACGSMFFNNVVAMTGGGLQIQNNGAGQPVQIRNNVFGGGVFGESNFVAMDNLDNVQGILSAIYADPANANFTEGNDISMAVDRAVTLPEVPEDYCGTPRSAGMSDLGPIEFPAACATFPWGSNQPPLRDGGVDVDGGSVVDGGTQAVVDGGPSPTVDGGSSPTIDSGPIGARDPALGGGGCTCGHTRVSGANGFGVIGLLLLIAVRRRQ